MGGEGKKHNRLAWKAAVTTVMESILLNHLTSTQQLVKKKKRPHQDASVRLPEITEGRTTEVWGVKRSLTTSATSRSLTQQFARHLPASSVCLGCTQMASLKYPIWSLSYRVSAWTKDGSQRSVTPAACASAFGKSPGRGSKEVSGDLQAFSVWVQYAILTSK